MKKQYTAPRLVIIGSGATNNGVQTGADGPINSESWLEYVTSVSFIFGISCE